MNHIVALLLALYALLTFRTVRSSSSEECARMIAQLKGEWCVELRGPTLPSEWRGPKATVVETARGFTGILRGDAGFTHLVPSLGGHLVIYVAYPTPPPLPPPEDGTSRSSVDNAVAPESDTVELPDSYLLPGRRELAIPLTAATLTPIDVAQQLLMRQKAKARRRIRIMRRQRNQDGTRYPTMRPTVKPASLRPTTAPTAPTPKPVIARGLTVQTVSVMYSPQLAKAWPDVEGLIKLAVAETNQIYANSKIPIYLDLVYFGVTPFDETGDSYTDLVTFRGLGENPLGANMGVILTHMCSSCGRAYMDCGKYVPEAHCSRAIVKASCATGYYSFAHELGHLQGADHQALFDTPYSNRRFSDNLGYVAPGYTFRTVMAYAEYDEPRVPVFSSPDVTYKGQVAGVRGSANNVRVITATRNEIAELY